MEAVRTSETSVDNHSTRQYNPEDSSEHYPELIFAVVIDIATLSTKITASNSLHATFEKI
jgi:hypothetical protein